MGTDCLPVLPREKKLLVSSEDYGRDLTGVQNLRKKHKRLEAELAAHEPAIQVRPALEERAPGGGMGPSGTRQSFALLHVTKASPVSVTPSPQTGRKFWIWC